MFLLDQPLGRMVESISRSLSVCVVVPVCPPSPIQNVVECILLEGAQYNGQNSNVNLKVVLGDFPIKYGPKTIKHPW